MKKIFLLVFITFIHTAFAGGFQINLQGQKQTGMGHAGTGLFLDHASILFNPGAVSFLDSLKGASLGLSFIIPRTTYLEKHPGTYTAHPVKHVGTPFTLYAVYKFKPQAKWNVGLGIYTPFGSKVEWTNDWKGQFLIREIDLKTIFIQPTFSYRVNEKLGIGLGLIYATGSFGLRKGVPIQDSTGAYGEGELNGKASGFGFNGGIYYQATEKFSIGIDYRSAVKVSIDGGTAEFKVPSSVSEYFPSTTFSTGITLPQVVTVGLGYAPNHKYKFAVDVNWVGWKSYDSLIIDFTANTDKLKDIHSAREYKNSTIFRIGGQYQFSHKFLFRAGAYYDRSPVKNGYLTPETPDSDKIGITAGMTINVTKRFNMDFSFLFIEGMERTDTNIETQFSGTYKTRAFVPGVSLGYLF